jgi:orotate phosphoribosyltransferase
MEQYKGDFIDFLLDAEALKIGRFKLKSGRISPYFINTGDLSDGKSLSELGLYYAAGINDALVSGDLPDFDLVFGPAYKGIPLASTTAISLFRDYGINRGYAFDRKEAKEHGEGTGEECKEPVELKGMDLQKIKIVGRRIQNGMGVLLLDDVLTTGKTKNDAIELLDNCATDLKYQGLFISGNRQEVGASGKSAVEEFESATGIKVYSVVDLVEIVNHLTETEKVTPEKRAEFLAYVERYGTEEAKDALLV